MGTCWLAEILKRHDGEGTTAKAIALAADESRSSVYNWLSGAHSPSVDVLPLLYRSLPFTIVDEIHAHLEAQRPPRSEAGDDANGDGRVDARDAAIHGARAIRSAAELEELLTRAVQDSIISGEELADIVLRANQVRRELDRAQRSAAKGRSWRKGSK